MTTTTTETTAQRLQAEAREAYRASAAEGAPLTGAELGERYGRGARWGQARIAEARAAAVSSPVRYPGEVPLQGLPPVTTPPAERPEDAPAPSPAPEDAPGALEAQGSAQQAHADPAVDGPDTVEADGANSETAMMIMDGSGANAETAPAAAERVPAVRRPIRTWPVWLLMAPAAVAIWGGWVGLGEMAGFGPVNLLPGIAEVHVNTAITLPIGMEVYAAYALYVWLSGRARGRALAFARRSAITSLVIGAAGQVAYHVMEAAGVGVAPWWITAAVACLPVAVLGMGAALAHMVHAED